MNGWRDGCTHGPSTGAEPRRFSPKRRSRSPSKARRAKNHSIERTWQHLEEEKVNKEDKGTQADKEAQRGKREATRAIELQLSTHDGKGGK